MKLTAKTITDRQIRKLHDAGAIDNGTYRGAILVPAQHSSLGRRVRRESRTHCAEIFNARAKGA